MNLPYDLSKLPREQKRHYISADDADLKAMLAACSLGSLDELYSHLPKDVMFAQAPNLPEELPYERVLSEMEALSKKNKLAVSFLGDGLGSWKVPEIVPHVLGIRELTTSYTPYQPERSQGTLATLWAYQSTLAQLTGMEAVNSSMYDRSTAAFEAMNCAEKLTGGRKLHLVCASLYPGDQEVIETYARHTGKEIITVDVSAEGTTDLNRLKAELAKNKERLASVVFPQVSCFGCLEDVDTICDITREAGVKSIAIVDPILLGPSGLKAPASFGKFGADMMAGEGQHLAIGPNFGGPGLGVFAIRFNETIKNDIRSTAGRFIGQAKDVFGTPCLVMVLSTREQHIRRDKATSNICSNEAFIATLAGAALLQKGDSGMDASLKTARAMTEKAYESLTSCKSVKPAFAASFYNEFTLKVEADVSNLISKAAAVGLHIGVDVSSRIKGGQGLLKLSFSDLTSEADVAKLAAFFKSEFGEENQGAKTPVIPSALKRSTPAGLKSFPLSELKNWYNELGQQNISPDSSCYPLGSCTMKYNPYINDYAASLPGWSDIHPQAPIEDVQGAIELLGMTQDWFARITGLAAVTTQPVAGANGELAGVKMFQAYHADRGEKRDILLIPRSAHGTNPATASVAGYTTEGTGDTATGIILIEADATGCVSMEHFNSLIDTYGKRIAGIMVTNPNTSGIFESRFKEMAERIHAIGALVYMDGANMNAIAAWVDLGKLGVDAVHNNTHKTWSIPHGGGGPGDAFVAVSERLVPYLTGVQAEKKDGKWQIYKTGKSIGAFHRHYGNFGHKVRAMTYLMRLGREGVRRMSAVAVLCARYLQARLDTAYPLLPSDTAGSKRMHEFILTLDDASFKKVESAGIKHSDVIGRFGKLFLDFGFHAPTVAFPEVYGLMIEPTESYTKSELDRFADCVLAMKELINENPEVLETVPHFTPIAKVDEVTANKQLCLSAPVTVLPRPIKNRRSLDEIWNMSPAEIKKAIVEAHKIAKECLAGVKK